MSMQGDKLEANGDLDHIRLSVGQRGDLKRLRDQFAMAALPGLITRNVVNNILVADRQELIAQTAYQLADAMLKERER